MKYLALLGRIFYSSIFIIASITHFSPTSIQYATSVGIPMASITLPFSGLLALLGGLSILLGFKAKIGAWLIVAFSLLILIMLHKSWSSGSFLATMQNIQLLKDLSLMGAALLIAHFGSGPLSLKR